MTTTLTNTFTSTLLGRNRATQKAPIGVISFNTTTGQVKQCEVYTPFWSNSSTPDHIDINTYLVSKGVGLVRRDTVRYSPLV